MGTKTDTGQPTKKREQFWQEELLLPLRCRKSFAWRPARFRRERAERPPPDCTSAPDSALPSRPSRPRRFTTTGGSAGGRRREGDGASPSFRGTSRRGGRGKFGLRAARVLCVLFQRRSTDPRRWSKRAVPCLAVEGDAHGGAVLTVAGGGPGQVTSAHSGWSLAGDDENASGAEKFKKRSNILAKNKIEMGKL